MANTDDTDDTDDTEASGITARDTQICSRILNDTIGHLAGRFGIGPVVMALTDIVGCQSCVSDPSRGASIRALIEKVEHAGSVPRVVTERKR